jgi:flagellar motor protein MotB
MEFDKNIGENNMRNKTVLAIIAMLCLLVDLEVFAQDTRGFAGTAWNANNLRPVVVNMGGVLRFQIYYLHRQGPQGIITPLTNGSLLRVGDAYGIVFTPATNCYVYIFQIDSSGNIGQLFPVNPLQGISPDNFNPVWGGKTYYVPAQVSPFQVVTQPIVQHIDFLASQSPDAAVEEQYQVMLEAQARRNPHREQLIRAELIRTIQRKRISGVTPVIHTNWVDSRSFHDPMIEQEIVRVLRMPPPPGSPDIRKLYPKGLSEGGVIRIEESLLEKMPKVSLLNLFKDQSATIVPESYPVLDEYGKALQNELQQVVLVIAGHTDNQGSKPENLDLSQRRAEAVKQFLMSEFQIAEHRLLIQPYGASKPMVSNETAEGRRLNNRIELIRVE